ncbi:hypothetical protein LWF15_00075 [Kineosporia rhizophila]|uniref:hypothetical protein n=1 Tax=Kineosporia rhizophila TaxID=84633 RepID=UPI001E5E4F7B|nr:hypothetical protein [Kineosporia rhizophila]MCE0533901.1 hypothetical protein [Kineosporia rhizophila]
MGTMRRPPGVLAGSPAGPVTPDARPSSPSRSRAAGLERRRADTVRAVAGWVALPLLLITGGLVFLDLGQSSAAVLGTAGLVLFWFVAARTKTLSWSSVAGLLMLSVPWGVLVAVAAWGTALVLDPERVTGAVVLPEATVLSALLQQSLLVVPLLLIPLLLPSRARRLSFTDWLLAGVVVGAGFQLAAALIQPDGMGGLSPSPFAGPQPGLVGQHVLTGLAAAGVGFAVAARRHADKASLSVPGRLLWLALAGGWPLLMWWLAVSAHAQANLERVLGETSYPSPDVLELGWWLSAQGRALGWLLVALLVLGLMVDAGRLRNAAELEPDPVPHPFHPVNAADAWAGRATRWAGTSQSRPVSALVWLVATTCSVFAFAGRDLGVVLAAVRRSGRGSGAVRWTAITRARAAGVMVRWVRAEAIGLAADPDRRVSLWRNRLGAALGIVLLAAAAFGLGPWWVDQLPRVSVSSELAAATWPGEAVAQFPSWWENSGVSGGVWVVQVVAVLLMLAGVADWSAFGGRDTFLTRRPVPLERASVAEYLRGTSVSAALVDLFCLLAGTLPSRADTHPSGTAIRAAVGDFRADPPTFVERRRRQIRSGAAAVTAVEEEEPLPVVPRRRSPEDLPALKLADGRLLSPLSADAEREFAGHLNGLERFEPEVAGRGEEWRARLFGRYQLMVANRPEIWSSGTTERSLDYGMCVLGLWYSGGASWQVAASLPDTLPDAVRHRADLELDRRLIEFTTVVNYPGNPFRAVEVVVSDPRVAESVQARMDRLAIPGVVVVAS